MKKLVGIGVVALTAIALSACSQSSKHKKVGSSQVYSTSISSVKTDSSGDWVIKGTTSAPDGAKIIATPTSDTNANYGDNGSQSKDLAAWPKVKNGKFTALLDVVDISNSTTGKVGNTTRVAVVAVSNYNHHWDNAKVSSKIVDAAKSESSLISLKIDKRLSSYVASLDDDSDNSTSDSTDGSTSSSSGSSESSSNSSQQFNAGDYNSAITYDQLARNPKQYKGEKISLTGEVFQVTERKSENDLLISINGDSDDMVMIGYKPSIMNGSRVLENDKITFYGTSIGTYSYESTGSGKVTVPGIYVDKIEDSGVAPDDYGE
jgi:hypothetical protein